LRTKDENLRIDDADGRVLIALPHRKSPIGLSHGSLPAGVGFPVLHGYNIITINPYRQTPTLHASKQLRKAPGILEPRPKPNGQVDDAEHREGQMATHELS
jgi:hypothetical protein